jgi:hypothetical protein
MEDPTFGLLAGAAKLEITPEPGCELMGYGARSGLATGIHDPLYARALALRQEEGPAAILVSADLCLLSPARCSAVRSEIARRTGRLASEVLLGCTHTHSGPDTGLGAELGRREPPLYLAALFERLAAAGVKAYEAAIPARARWLRAQARIGRNRRRADGPEDPELLVLHVEGAGGGTLAVLYHHGCHATVLGHDNLEISADWPGEASGRIEREAGGVAPFLLGSHADVDPRTRGLMDLAIDGQSRGLGFDAVRVLGGEVAEAVLGALRRPEAPRGDLPLRALSRSIRLPVHGGERPEEATRKDLEGRKRELGRFLGLEPESFPRLSELRDRVRSRVANLPPTEAREWIARARLYLRDRTARFWTGGEPEVEVEAQLLRIGDAALLGLPLEPTTAVGLDWKRRVRLRIGVAALAGIANGWLRYLPHPEDLADPLAHQRYEILESLLAPPACERLLALGEELLAEALAASPEGARSERERA